MYAEIEVVNVIIDGVETDLSEQEITEALIDMERVRFLQSFQGHISISDMMILMKALPTSVYFGELFCGVCEETVRFEQDTIQHWGFDPKVYIWVCPECMQATADKIAETEAALVAASEQDKAEDGESVDEAQDEAQDEGTSNTEIDNEGCLLCKKGDTCQLNMGDEGCEFEPIEEV